MLFSVSSTSGNLGRVRLDARAGRTVGPPVMLTRGPNGFAAPDVSPDNAWVAFGSYAVRHDTDENIYVARTDGTGLRELTHESNLHSRARFVRESRISSQPWP